MTGLRRFQPFPRPQSNRRVRRHAGLESTHCTLSDNYKLLSPPGPLYARCSTIRSFSKSASPSKTRERNSRSNADPSRRRTVMSIENTDLERRVLAHEQILQVLIAHLAEAEPKFLDRLKEIFTQQRTLGANEHDYTDTAAYAEQFIQQVAPLTSKGRRS